MEWKEIKIKDLGKVITGTTPPTAERNYYGSIYPLIKPSDMISGQRFVSHTEERLSYEVEKKFKRFILPKDSTCVVTIGSIGKQCFTTEESMTNQQLNSIIPIEEYDARFVYYLMEYYNPKVKIMSSGSASGRENVNKSSFENIKIKVPASKETRKKIGILLSTYDDLIENNQKRITILEKMAQNLYKEWFVRFRFPGWEEEEFVDGLPKGWKKKPISNYVDTQYGFTASANDNNLLPKFLRITDIVPNHIDWDKVPNCEIENSDLEKYLLEEGDIVVARTGANTGWAKRIGSNLKKSVFASYLVRLKCKLLLHNIIIGQAVESELYKKYIQSISTGAAQPQASAILLVMFKIVMPDEDILKEYNKIIAPLLKQQEFLLTKNQLLKQIRNRLLPRLLSGKLKI